MSRLPKDAKARKNVPLFRGLFQYFPDALCAVAEVSRIGNEQHNPGEPMHWAKEKSTDEADCVLRHMLDAGTLDADGTRHTAKVAWRALALLQREIEAERKGSTPDAPPTPLPPTPTIAPLLHDGSYWRVEGQMPALSHAAPSPVQACNRLLWINTAGERRCSNFLGHGGACA